MMMRPKASTGERLASGARAAAGAKPPGAGPGRGFTIVEIMLAIAIFSMVISAIYASWSAILRASRVGGDAAAEVQRSRVAARTLEDALLSAVLFAGNGRLYYFEGDATEDFAWLSFVGRLPPSFPGSGYFGDQVVRRVAFSVEAGNDGVNQLLLRQMPLLQTNVDENEDFTIVLARDVKLFGMEFWDARRNDWTDRWLTTNQLPKLVRYALAFGPAAVATRPEDVTVRVVNLPSTVVPADAQMGRGAGPGAPRVAGGVAPPGVVGPPGGQPFRGGSDRLDQQSGAGQRWNQSGWNWPGQSQPGGLRGRGLERPQRVGGRR
jgi:prepilin-type N-terminal cleavage/methylation domain-containing protein